MKIEIFKEYTLNEFGGIAMPTKTGTVDLNNPKDYIYENNGRGIYLIKKDKIDRDSLSYFVPNRDYYRLSKDIEDKSVFD